MKKLNRRLSVAVVAGATAFLVAATPVLAATTSAIAAGSKQPVPSATSVQLTQTYSLKSIHEQEMMEISQRAGKYLELNPDGTVSLNASATQLGTNQYLLDQYQSGLTAINGAIKRGLVKVKTDGKSNLFLVANSSSRVHPEWAWDGSAWGFDFYLNEKETVQLEGRLNAWAAEGAAVSMVAGWIASKGIPYAAAAALAAGLVSAGLWWAASKMQATDNGNGVRIYESNWNPIVPIQFYPL